MGSFSRDVDREAAELLEEQARNAIQRTIAIADGYYLRTVRARLGNELAAVGLHLDGEWVLTVAEPITRGETPSMPPLRFRVS